MEGRIYKKARVKQVRYITGQFSGFKLGEKKTNPVKKRTDKCHPEIRKDGEYVEQGSSTRVEGVREGSSRKPSKENTAKIPSMNTTNQRA